MEQLLSSFHLDSNPVEESSSPGTPETHGDSRESSGNMRRTVCLGALLSPQPARGYCPTMGLNSHAVTMPPSQVAAGLSSSVHFSPSKITSGSLSSLDPARPPSPAMPPIIQASPLQHPPSLAIPPYNPLGNLSGNLPSPGAALHSPVNSGPLAFSSPAFVQANPPASGAVPVKLVPPGGPYSPQANASSYMPLTAEQAEQIKRDNEGMLNRLRIFTAATARRAAGSRPRSFNESFYKSDVNRVSTIRAIVAQSARLPLLRRHELLAAARNQPELAPAFQRVPPSEAAVSDRSRGGLRTQVMPPMPGLHPELDFRLRELVKMVRSAPAPQVPEPAAEAPIGSPDVLSVSVVAEYEQYGLAAETVRAVVSLKAVPEHRKRARVALTCVLDRSKSMSGLPIQLVRETCHFLIDQLTCDDFLGLVSYSEKVREDLPLIRMTPAARMLAHAVVDELVAGGNTSLYDGLEAGVKQQMAAETELGAGSGAGDSSHPSLSLRMVNCCFLFTDGQATNGPTNPEGIISKLQELQAPSSQHVTLYTFGFGSDHSVELLQKVAEAQSGVYYYINSADDIPSAFGDALGGLLAVVAKSVRVEVRPRTGINITAFRSGGRAVGSSTPTSTPRISGRPSPAASALTGATFNDIFAGETRECLLILYMPPSVVPFTDLVVVNLEYTDVATGRFVERTTDLRAHRSAEPRPMDQLPAELVFVTAARFETLDAIEAAQRASEENDDDVTNAHLLLDAQLVRLQSGPLRGPQLTALAEQTRMAKSSIKPRTTLDQCSAAAVAGAVQVLRQQRVATSTAAGPPIYEQYDHKSKKTIRESAIMAVGNRASRQMPRSPAINPYPGAPPHQASAT